jgi:hypothetical protein
MHKKCFLLYVSASLMSGVSLVASIDLHSKSTETYYEQPDSRETTDLGPLLSAENLEFAQARVKAYLTVIQCHEAAKAGIPLSQEEKAMLEAAQNFLKTPKAKMFAMLEQGLLMLQGTFHLSALLEQQNTLSTLVNLENRTGELEIKYQLSEFYKEYQSAEAAKNGAHSESEYIKVLGAARAYLNLLMPWMEEEGNPMRVPDTAEIRKVLELVKKAERAGELPEGLTTVQKIVGLTSRLNHTGDGAVGDFFTMQGMLMAATVSTKDCERACRMCNALAFGMRERYPARAGLPGDFEQLCEEIRKIERCLGFLEETKAIETADDATTLRDMYEAGDAKAKVRKATYGVALARAQKTLTEEFAKKKEQYENGGYIEVKTAEGLRAISANDGESPRQKPRKSFGADDKE